MFDYDRFEQLRRSKGITKKFIAQSLGRSATLCQDWKQHKSQPSPDQLRQVAEILGTSPDYLMGETEEPAPAAGDELTCSVEPAHGEKCPRCWNFRELGEDGLCPRCSAAVAALGDAE